jgi:zinc D-Ala-D-Ala carboxypeptidase
MRRCYGRRISPAYRKPHTRRQHRAVLTGRVIHGEPAPISIYRTRVRRRRVAGLLVVIAALAAVLAHQQLESSSTRLWSPTPSPSSTVSSADAPAMDDLRSDQRGALGEADGAVPDGTTVFDDAVPGVARLDADLLGALRRAGTDAADEGVRLLVDSGWRSAAYQEHLLQQAVSEHGSEQEAARWVATPNTSAHVSGDAVDIGPSAAAAWLAEHGAAYGLCRTYGNEPWHFELRPQAGAGGCPPMYADPTHDPRMQQ